MKTKVTISTDEMDSFRRTAAELTAEGLVLDAQVLEHRDGKAADVYLEISAPWVLFHLGQAFEVERQIERRKREREAVR